MLLNMQDNKPLVDFVRKFIYPPFNFLITGNWFYKKIYIWLAYLRKSDINLHLASGHNYLKNYINIDINRCARVDINMDVRKIKKYFRKNSVNSVMTLHFLSYLRFWEAQIFLKDCYDILKEGGKIIIEIPDISKIAKNISSISSLEGDEKNYSDYLEMMRAIYAFDMEQHKNREHFSTYAFGWSAMHLKHEMEKIGFKNIEILEPCYHGNFVNRDFRLEAGK